MNRTVIALALAAVTVDCAPDAIRIRYRGNMVKGFDEIRKFDSPYISDTTTVLNWEPTDAHVFRGGDIASTTGRYWAVTQGWPTKNPVSFRIRGGYWWPTRPNKLDQ